MSSDKVIPQEIRPAMEECQSGEIGKEKATVRADVFRAKVVRLSSHSSRLPSHPSLSVIV